MNKLTIEKSNDKEFERLMGKRFYVKHNGNIVAYCKSKAEAELTKKNLLQALANI